MKGGNLIVKIMRLKLYGLYFGKNTYTDNQNIFITGIINSN